MRRRAIKRIYNCPLIFASSENGGLLQGYPRNAWSRLRETAVLLGHVQIREVMGELLLARKTKDDTRYGAVANQCDNLSIQNALLNLGRALLIQAASSSTARISRST
jgi:hypothetical protein